MVYNCVRFVCGDSQAQRIITEESHRRCQVKWFQGNTTHYKGKRISAGVDV